MKKCNFVYRLKYDLIRFFDNLILAYFFEPPSVTQYKRRYAPTMFVLFLFNYSYMQTYVWRQNSRFMFNSRKFMRRNAIKRWKLAGSHLGFWRPFWIFLYDSLTLGPKLFSRPLPSNWYWKRNLCIKLKWKHKNTYAQPPLLGFVQNQRYGYG